MLRILWACALVVVGCTCATGAHAQPSTLIVPYPAGQISDLIGRALKDALARQGAPNVVVENVAGAAGLIAAQRLLSMAPDSGAVMLGSPNELILAPLVNAAAKYKAEDFQLVAMVASGPLVLVTRSDLPVSSADELVELARSVSAQKPLSYGSVGVGSLLHLMGEQLSQVIRAKLTHIPYKGGAPLMQDLVGARLDFAMVPYSQMLQGLLDQGRVRMLGSVAKTRPEVLARVPTVNEGRTLDGFAFDIWTGVVVTKDVSQPRRDQVHGSLSQAIEDPQLRATLQAQGLTVARPLSLEALEALYRAETRRYRDLAASIRLTPQ